MPTAETLQTLGALIGHQSGAEVLSHMLSSSPDLAYVLKADGQIHFVSSADHPLLSPVADRPASGWLSSVMLEDRPLVQQNLEQAARGQSVTVEYRHLPPGGPPIWCEAQVRPLSQTRAGPLLVFVRDITARKAVEAELLESEARKAVMLDASLDAVITTDDHGQVVEWNAAAVQMFGYAREDVLGRNISTLIVPPDHRVQHTEAMAHHRGGGLGRILGKRVELTALRANQQPFACELTVVPITMNHRGHYVAYLRDLSQQRETARLLHERQIQLQQVTAQLPSVLWTTDRDLRLTTALGASLKDLNIDPVATLGQEIASVLKGAPNFEQAMDAHFGALVGISGGYTLRVAHRDFDVYLEPFRNEAGEIVGCLGLAIDVTERERAHAYEAARSRIMELIARGSPLEHTLHQVTTLLETQCPGCSAQILSCTGDQLLLAAAPSLPETVLEVLRAGLTIGPFNGSCGAAAHSKAPYIAVDIETDPVWADAKGVVLGHHLRACWTVPVLASDQTVLGTVALYHPVAASPSPADLEVLNNAAHLVSIAMERARDLRQIISTREESLRTLGVALEFRDYETKGHTDRVVTWSLRLASALGIEGADLDALRWGAYLHDVGKIVVPDQVLLKPGRPTPEEWKLIQQHPEVGYQMLRNIPTLPNDTLDVVRHHHERWDGSGYPGGLAGDGIPRLARLFSVVDVYDALVNVRPYKRAWTHEEAMAELWSAADVTLDRGMVEAFARLHSGADESWPGMLDL